MHLDWVSHFQLFLFDFDGLLVNTEHIHYQAYMNMLSQRGYFCDWDFGKFCSLAHLNSDALREQIYLDFPDIDPNWQAIYAEKKACYKELLVQGRVELMPGVEPLLQELSHKDIRRCVVTNSPLDQIQIIKKGLPILQTIPHFVTREDYVCPKPDPECYLRAIELYGKKGDRIIGFEDSLRGLKALMGTPAVPVLISLLNHPLIEGNLPVGSLHFESLDKVLYSF